jgi:hypothetical protein
MTGRWPQRPGRRKYQHRCTHLFRSTGAQRAAPLVSLPTVSYKGPDEIEVFHKGQWFCTAFAYDSPKGEQVTGHDVARAQRRQRRGYRGQITEERRNLRQVDKQIADEKPPQQQPLESSSPAPESQAVKGESSTPNQSTSPAQPHSPQSPGERGSTKKGSRRPHFLERMKDD